MAKEPGFLIQPPCITCELISGSDNTVAGYEDADRIAAHSLSYGLC